MTGIDVLLVYNIYYQSLEFGSSTLFFLAAIAEMIPVYLLCHCMMRYLNKTQPLIVGRKANSATPLSVPISILICVVHLYMLPCCKWVDFIHSTFKLYLLLSRTLRASLSIQTA